MLALFDAGLSSGCRSAGLNKEIAKKISPRQTAEQLKI
jgi:hypothetical protein